MAERLGSGQTMLWYCAMYVCMSDLHVCMTSNNVGSGMDFGGSSLEIKSYHKTPRGLRYMSGLTM